MMIKDNIDYQTALKYQKALEKAGAICHVESLTNKTPTIELKQDQASSSKESDISQSGIAKVEDNNSECDTQQQLQEKSLVISKENRFEHVKALQKPQASANEEQVVLAVKLPEDHQRNFETPQITPYVEKFKEEHDIKNKSKSYYVIVAIILIISVILGGFWYFRQNRIQSARSELALAYKKHDLEAMYLLLKELERKGALDSEEKQELQRVENGIDLVEKIKESIGEHEREMVVISSAQLLEIYPENPFARNTLKSSATIYLYLENVLASMNNCFL